MKTAISIPDSEFRAAEKLAKRLGISRSELYQAALSNYLARHAETGITEKLNQVYAAEGEEALLSPDVQWMQARSVPEEKW